MPAPDGPEQRLRERGLMAPWPVLRNQVDKNTGSGYMTIEYRGKGLTVWVREVPEFVSKGEVPGYVILRSNDASGLSTAGHPDPYIRSLENAEARFLAKVVEVLTATGDRKKPYVWFIGDCGTELTVGARIKWGRRIRPGDLVQGSSTVELVPDLKRLI